MTKAAWIAIGLAAISVAGCKKKAAKPDPAKSDPAKPDPAKPDPVKPDPAKPDPAPGAPAGGEATPVVEPAAGSTADCEAAVRHIFELGAATDDPAVQAEVTADKLPTKVAECQSEHWLPTLLECEKQAATFDAYTSGCLKAAFQGEIDMKPVRVINPREDNSALDPKAMTQDGDFEVYREDAQGNQCGSMIKTVPGAEAMFVVCEGKVIAGPLTTPKEIAGVMQELQDTQKQGHDLTMSIMQNWPSGNSGRYKVYDKNGNYLRTE